MQRLDATGMPAGHAGRSIAVPVAGGALLFPSAPEEPRLNLERIVLQPNVYIGR